MANSNQFNILKSGVAKWNIWREKHPLERIDLEGAQLTNIDLREINLRDTNLINVNFSGSNLINACCKLPSIAPQFTIIK